MERAPKQFEERKSVQERIINIKNQWKDLKIFWEQEGCRENPLSDVTPETDRNEEIFRENIIQLLNCPEEDGEILYAEARKIKTEQNRAEIYQRAAIHVTNVCRANCLCCPMRRENLTKDSLRRATVDEIVEVAGKAYELGFRDIFIQGGEDVQIIPTVVETIRRISDQYTDVEFTLNLGSLNERLYGDLFDAGARKYVIKHESATPQLHKSLRENTIENRVESMITARRAGFAIGSGNILGIPGQTDRDLAEDIIFLGRMGIEDMISCTPYTASDVLPEPYRSQPAGDWEKTKRFVAILRLLFPGAHIHAPSNAESEKITRKNRTISGQAELVQVGADEISVEFTPARIADQYGLYGKPSEREPVSTDKAGKITREVSDESR